MKMIGGKAASVGALVFVAVTSACRGGDLEVRTFELEHLDPGTAASLIDPYVYGERADAPGTVSVIEGAVTVRETPDNLDQIARVLAEFDRPQPDARLHFQLIEADGFVGADERIADVEEELRRIFQFRGYRLAGEAVVAISDGSEIQQRLRTSDGLYQITGTVGMAASSGIRVHHVSLWDERSGLILETSVNVRLGQTLVLGSSPKDGSPATLLLTLRAEEGPGPQ